MAEEPSAGELLLLFLMVGGTVTLAGGAVVLSLVGLVVWVNHRLRRRRRLGPDRSTRGRHDT
ncbi:hypothetical protein [Streptomyces sp. NPDC051214]|uniref:hypothetical protein n=1 Tax=Streptomyces sp. NPDC051214 TaxID=3155282 RepID=UPI003449417D